MFYIAKVFFLIKTKMNYINQVYLILKIIKKIVILIVINLQKNIQLIYKR